MKFGELEMEPERNPAVLDTATWAPAAAVATVRAIGARWLDVRRALATGAPVPSLKAATVHAASHARCGDASLFLVELPDAQQTLVCVGPGGAGDILGVPLARVPLDAGTETSVYAADAANVAGFCRLMNPVNAPRALGRTPRLGIGVRMTTAVWPGIFDAMGQADFAANTIQNSVRELNLLDALLAARPAPKNYACGFGEIETGYTGSSFEGLWLAGVLAALRHDRPLRYGADADHIQVKRADAGLAQAKRVLDAARYYTFYTIDVSDVLDYAVLSDGARGGGSDARFAAKYTAAMDALTALVEHLNQLKRGQPFDLELSIDEHPAEVGAFDCLTSDEELSFVLRELQRRGLPVTHIAPNLGMEKGVDFRHPDGLEGLYRRTRAQHALAERFGCMLDIHSADDLGPAVRETLRKATGGRVHYKISPSLQLLFAEVLRDFHPDLYQRWWRDAEAYARRSAEGGSAFAAECLAAETPVGHLPTPSHPVFHHYSFAFVGRRDGAGRFVNRPEFYSLSQAFYRAYRDRVSERLVQLAHEVFG
ncbi:MAG: tagaturonate epimerase family protein [Kiritimatiellae bacterium]|nr:tagaturonate epimerase family protein [Kiritimatiellia bacterium]